MSQRLFFPIFIGGARITDVTVDYTEAYDARMFRYSRDYATLPLVDD